ncbi:MAG: hypothetical protein LBO06_00235 [Bacteroidales bacterium]|jgi:cytochrome c-type biogenesis protein CcmH/NrfG|nr:hypothetical protein [Bacteroidales bacterium]
MRFLKINKPRQFEYKPRFYDPQKEELEQLKAKYGPIEGESYKRRIDFRSAMKEKKEEKVSKPVPFMKILVFACLAVGLLYILLYFVEKWQ